MKNRLFTPGPTPVPERAALRMAESPAYHRGPEFRAVLRRVHDNLRYLFQTEHPVLTLACSGTGGVEATFVSLFSPGDTIIAVNGGKFGARWVEMPRAFGLHAVELKVPWGEAPGADALRDILHAHPEARAVYLTQSETSTGTATDIRALAAVIREESQALVCVDGISSIGAMEMRFDAWGVDVCVTASQKGLMIPPGLAFVALGPRAQDAVASARLPRFYFDLGRALKAYAADDTPWTPAISLVTGVDASLQMIREEGLESLWERHTRMARALRGGAAAVGLRLFSHSPSASVTAICVPVGIAWKDLNTTLRHDLGVTVAGGQGDYAGKIFRIAHLGWHDELDMVAVMAALERSLAAHGHPFTPGAGLAAVQASFMKGNV